MAERTWGLNSLARCEQVGLDLDESTDDGPLTYMLTLGVPSLELRFEIAGPDATRALSEFMHENYGRKACAEVQIDGLPVRIIKDDEHADRFFIIAAREGMIHVTLVDPVTSDLVRATAELAVEAAGQETNPMARAWLDAAEDLGIRVTHPFTFRTKSGVSATTSGVFLPDFGAPAGTLLLCRFDRDELQDLAADTDFFESALNPDSYEPYRRELYIDTLNDWGWFGAKSSMPSWFTGAYWGHGGA